MPEGSYNSEQASIGTQDLETDLNSDKTTIVMKKTFGGIIKCVAGKILPDFRSQSFDPKRRKILLTGAGAVVGLAVARIGAVALYKDYIDPLDQYNAETSAERIEKVGLGDFLPFYNSVSNLLNTYGEKPLFSLSNPEFIESDNTDPYYILQSIATSGYYRDDDSAYSDGIRILRNDWGEKREQAKRDAHEKVKEMEVIIMDKTLPDTVSGVRAAYNRFAEVVPPMVMMGPNRLEIVDSGGGYLGPSYDLGSIKPYFSIESAANDLEGFYRSGMHELAHAEVEWRDGKAYVNRKAYADYINIEAKNIKLALDDYFSKDWKDAQVYLKGNSDGSPLIYYYDSDYQLTSVPYHNDNPHNSSVELNFKNLYGIDLDTIAPLTEGQKQDRSMVFNRIIWAAGKHQLEVLQRQANRTLTEADRNYLQDEDVQALLSRAVGEMDHYYRGPVQRSGLGLPGNNFPPDEPRELITKLNIEVQQARLRAFSTLSPQELTSFANSSQALRNHFDIDKPPIALPS